MKKLAFVGLAGWLLGLLIMTACWLHANRVWITIQTEDQRMIAAQYSREGSDMGEMYQTVVKF